MDSLPGRRGPLRDASFGHCPCDSGAEGVITAEKRSIFILKIAIFKVALFCQKSILKKSTTIKTR